MRQWKVKQGVCAKRDILSLTAISIVLAALTLTSTDIDSARLFFYRLPAKESFCSDPSPDSP